MAIWKRRSPPDWGRGVLTVMSIMKESFAVRSSYTVFADFPKLTDNVLAINKYIHMMTLKHLLTENDCKKRTDKKGQANLCLLIDPTGLSSPKTKYEQ